MALVMILGDLGAIPSSMPDRERIFILAPRGAARSASALHRLRSVFGAMRSDVEITILHGKAIRSLNKDRYRIDFSWRYLGRFDVFSCWGIL
jgi:hypothetical protein